MLREITTIGLMLLLTTAAAPGFGPAAAQQLPVVPPSDGDVDPDTRVITLEYAGATLDFDGTRQVFFPGLWNLNEGLTISYSIDLTGVNPTDQWETSWTDLGVWNAGPLGWVSHGSPGAFGTNPDSLDLDDKMNLGRPGGVDEQSYDVDCATSTIVPPAGPDGYNSYGVWFDRDGVDPWQETMWGMVDGGNYNTGGTYDVHLTITHDTGDTYLMCATVNGVMPGFHIGGYQPGQPAFYPAGKSFRTLSPLVTVSAVIGAPGPDFGEVVISDLVVEGAVV